MRDDGVLHRVVPKATVDEIPKEPRVDDLELAGENATRVDVPAFGQGQRALE